MKRGATLALDIIIVAVILLVVMVVIIYIFYTQTGAAKAGLEGISACESRGGSCKEACGPNEDGFYHYGGCPKKENQALEYCCIPVENE